MRGNLVSRLRCLRVRSEAICCVVAGEVEVSEGESSGRVISPWRRTWGSFRVVSTTVEVGRSANLPASRKSATMDCLWRVVYSCQSARQ